MEGLNPENITQLNKFLTFHKSKRQESLRELDLDYKELVDDKLQDSIYNKEDVQGMLQELFQKCKKSMEKDLSNASRMSAVYIKYLLLESQAQNVQLQANLNLIEDLKAIEQIQSIERGENVPGILNPEQDQLKGTKFFAKSLAKSGNTSKLLSLGQQNDIDINKKTQQDLEKEIENLKQQNQKLQQQLAQSSGGQPVEEQKSDSKDLSQKLKEMEQEMNKKLNESTQFKNLQKMIQQKNDQVKELKTKLSKYEKVD